MKNPYAKIISKRFDYNLNRTIDEIRPYYRLDVTCQGSVSEAIIAFLDSTSFEDALRNAVSLGGDSDTQACIAGSIAEAFYHEVPDAILQQVKKQLSRHLWKTITAFYRRYNIPGLQNF
ncbi:MAG: ADP-ribosylglycohydrolase family protein [Candidatus Hydrogenedentota bacterium]